jgi:hypothetical protein
MGESIGRVQALLDQPNSQLRNRLHQLIHTYLPHKNDSESVSLFRGASMLSTQQIPAISSTDPFLVNTDYLDTFVNEQCRLRTGCSFFNSLPLQRYDCCFMSSC